MPMKLVGGFYSVIVLGDGTSTSIDVDFYEQIANDHKIHNRTPDGVAFVTGTTASTTSLSGTVVTFSWSSPLGAGVQESPAVMFSFP